MLLTQGLADMQSASMDRTELVVLVAFISIFPTPVHLGYTIMQSSEKQITDYMALPSGEPLKGFLILSSSPMHRGGVFFFISFSDFSSQS